MRNLVYFSHAGKKPKPTHHHKTSTVSVTPLYEISALQWLNWHTASRFLVVWALVAAGYWQPFLFALEEVAPWFKLGSAPRASTASRKVGRRNASVAPSKAAGRTLSPGRQRSPRAEPLTSLPHHRICFHLEKCHVFLPPPWGRKRSGCTFPKQEKSLQRRAEGRWLWNLCETFRKRKPTVCLSIPMCDR